MREAEQLIAELQSRASEIDALVLLSGKPGNFIAGADIEMIGAVGSAQEGRELSGQGQEIFNRWEDLPFPTVAAVDGAALGGGCEFALACTALVMSNSPATRIGVPEVMLGLLPGAGGCLRIPRKVGLATALDLILTGRTLSGERAASAGLADAVIPRENFEQSVLAWTQGNLKRLRSGERIARPPKLGGSGGILGGVLERPVVRGLIFKKARRDVLSRTRGNYPAPLEAIEVLRVNRIGQGPKVRGEARRRALEREAAAFGRLAASETSRNLIRIFFMTERVKKSNGLPAGVSVETPPIHSAAVLGAGVMGGGIAQLFADKQVHVRMKDLSTQALVAGVQAATRLFKKSVRKRRMTPRQMVQKLGLIAPVTDYSGFMNAQIVVEAIVENMDVKKKVLRELEDQVKDECVIASNTSSLSITQMQTAMRQPARFAGMHFFNPVAKMPLIEVIRGAKSSDRAVATVFQFSKQLGKTPVVVKDAPGFLVNRLLCPYLNEATYLVAEGAPIAEVDEVMLEFGMPMGPLELIDEVGVDVGEKVLRILHDAFGERMAPAPLNTRVAKQGRLGKKSGKGMYVYEGRGKRLDPAIYEILGVTPRPGAMAAEEIVERCVLPMINEACRCLEEGVVGSAEEVDLAMIMGTGFPPFRGGLLRYADSLGPRQIVDRLKKYEARFGARFEPAPALLERARDGTRFYSS